MKSIKHLAMAHEWYRDIIKVARDGSGWVRDIVVFRDDKVITIKNRRSGDWGFRTGPSVFAQQDWFRITKTGGIIKTGSRTSEDFRQEDWFRVGGDHDSYVPWNRLAHTCPF